MIRKYLYMALAVVVITPILVFAQKFGDVVRWGDGTWWVYDQFSVDGRMIDPRPATKAEIKAEKDKIPCPNPFQKAGYIPTGSVFTSVQSVPKPNKIEGIKFCGWDVKRKRFVCVGKEDTVFSILMREGDGWYPEVYMLINNARDTQLYPKLFYYDPNTNRLLMEYRQTVLSEIKTERIKSRVDFNVTPKSVVLYTVPLVDLLPGQFKQVTGSDPINLGLQKEILDRLRDPFNKNLLTFANGVPFPRNFFTVRPPYFDIMKYTDRGLPSLEIRDESGKSLLVLALSASRFRAAASNLDAESPLVTPVPPSGPGADSLGSSVPPTIRQEIANAFATGKITYQIFIEILKISLGGDVNLGNKVKAITNKDGSQIGLLIALPGKALSEKPTDYIQYVFTDEKDARGAHGSDGVPDTAHAYFLNPDWSVRLPEIEITPSKK